MIRIMDEKDWKYVSKIYTQGLEQGISTFNTVCPSYIEWDTSHLQDCRFVEERNGKVVGWTALSSISSRDVYQGVVEVSIYVDEEYQGQGIGKSLLQKQCYESEKIGYWSLYSAIFTINEASISLHEKCGFRKIGYREKIAKDKYGKWQDTTLMERRSKKIL